MERVLCDWRCEEFCYVRYVECYVIGGLKRVCCVMGGNWRECCVMGGL